VGTGILERSRSGETVKLPRTFALDETRGGKIGGAEKTIDFVIIPLTEYFLRLDQNLARAA